jgi:hypothetical protein
VLRVLKERFECTKGVTIFIILSILAAPILMESHANCVQALQN